MIQFSKAKKIYSLAARWALPILGGILIVSMIRFNNQKTVILKDKLSLDSVAAQMRSFKNSNGQLVAENYFLKARSSEEIRLLTDSIFKLSKKESKKIKEVDGYTRIDQEIKISPKAAEIKEAQPAQPVAIIDTSHMIRVPASFEYIDSAIMFSGTVTKTNVYLDSFSLRNTVHLREVKKKTGFLNLGRETTVQAINSNQNIITTGAVSIRVENRVSWWHRWGKPVVFAALAAVATAQLKK